MPLPELIEIVPLDQPVRATITVPGSKSITNRALILAALAKGATTLRGALWSEDTQVMVDCLRRLGFNVEVEPDAAEVCNRSIKVDGLGGAIPRTGTGDQPLELFVGNAGTAARFLAALVCLGRGTYRLQGVDRMHQRPQAALFTALRELGHQVVATNDKLPATIRAVGPRRGKCVVSIAQSSQFASALLLCAEKGEWTVEVTGENIEESPYVVMTIKLIAAFPANGGEFQIEPDASSGGYFWAAGQLAAGRGSRVEVANWPVSGWQVDQGYRGICPGRVVSRRTDIGDSIMTAIVLAPFSAGEARFVDLDRLRVQECERVVALRTELARCGARVVETGNWLTVYPAPLHGAEIETYNDHRMAMCFAILGLKVPGIKIKNPACVKKTFPDFFQKLAAPPPSGLGAVIRDAATARPLSGAELFAD